MLKLIKLELKKNSLKRYIRGAGIANLVIIVIVFISYFASDQNEIKDLNSYVMGFSEVDAIVRATFLIFAAALLAKIVIGEYKNKTISILFMYPINRKKLITAKLIIVVAFTLISVMISDIIVSCGLLVINYFFKFITEPLTITIIFESLIKYLVDAIAISGIGLIPLFFGMRKKSVPATIVSEVILVSVISSNTGGISIVGISIGSISIGSSIIVPIILSSVGILIAYLTIRNIEKQDII